MVETTTAMGTWSRTQHATSNGKVCNKTIHQSFTTLACCSCWVCSSANCFACSSCISSREGVANTGTVATLTHNNNISSNIIIIAITETADNIWHDVNDSDPPFCMTAIPRGHQRLFYMTTKPYLLNTKLILAQTLTTTIFLILSIIIAAFPE